MTRLLEHLRGSMAGGRKLLVPYLMAGVPDSSSFPAAFAAVAEHADAVEVGLPYSDPLMDGPVIAAAGERAIRNGVGPLDALDEIAALDTPAHRIAMTYYNPIHRIGEAEFCRRAAKAGVRGLIVPDVPLEESVSLRAAADEEGLAWIPLVAPTTSPQRAEAIAGTATGFLYAVSTLGVTGTRASLSDRAAQVVELCRRYTDLPVLVGIGVSNAEQALSACETADGVVVGSAVVERVMDQDPASVQAFLGTLRSALGA